MMDIQDNITDDDDDFLQVVGTGGQLVKEYKWATKDLTCRETKCNKIRPDTSTNREKGNKIKINKTIIKIKTNKD
jgi:hypothetical protein